MSVTEIVCNTHSDRQPAVDAAAASQSRAATESLRFMRYARTLIIEPDYSHGVDVYQVHDLRVPYNWAGIDPFRGEHAVYSWDEVYERCFDLLVFLQDTAPLAGRWRDDCLQFDRQSLKAEYWQGIGEALAGVPDFEAHCEALVSFNVVKATEADHAIANRAALFARFDEWLDVAVDDSNPACV